ncbi:DUF2132 domain-containing protein [Candidatus Gracilibacteria bacterium]|nr:DUF2132 domain-containing protein [Candidatus Gracilibacteria bacterium]
MTNTDPLHGKSLEVIVTHLVETYGWEELGYLIDINCFQMNPSVKSSLKFLRKTPWARTKVERLYVKSIGLSTAPIVSSSPLI